MESGQYTDKRWKMRLLVISQCQIFSQEAVPLLGPGNFPCSFDVLRLPEHLIKFLISLQSGRLTVNELSTIEPDIYNR